MSSPFLAFRRPGDKLRGWKIEGGELEEGEGVVLHIGFRTGRDENNCANLFPAVKDTPKNQTSFTVTIPDLGTACKVAGDCVLQWWWYGTKARQTYESCVDFTIAPTVPTVPTVRSRFFNF